MAFKSTSSPAVAILLVSLEILIRCDDVGTWLSVRAVTPNSAMAPMASAAHRRMVPRPDIRPPCSDLNCRVNTRQFQGTARQGSNSQEAGAARWGFVARGRGEFPVVRTTLPRPGPRATRDRVPDPVRLPGGWAGRV